MDLIKTTAEINQRLDNERAAGATIGFVPTMGALHEGHLQLVKTSLQENDLTVCSIFVNPTQFNDSADLENYPRRLAGDGLLLQETGCHIAFVPSPEDIYPAGTPTLFPGIYANLETVMEGTARPGHFNGVKTVVDLLFRIVRPTCSYFGEKDYQQLAIIRQLAAELHPGVTIVGCPTVRNANGLALSSRNERLTAADRKAAATIPAVLSAAREAAQSHSVSVVVRDALQRLWREPGLTLEYFEIRDSVNLLPVTSWDAAPRPRAFVAARAGKVRLIDNMLLRG